jgi:hypothetical protein
MVPKNTSDNLGIKLSFEETNGFVEMTTTEGAKDSYRTESVITRKG